MRLSIACAATDTDYQNRIILHDNTLNLPVGPSTRRRAALPAPRGPAIKLMHSWGYALREGVFAETKEGKIKHKREKS